MSVSTYLCGIADSGNMERRVQPQFKVLGPHLSLPSRVLRLPFQDSILLTDVGRSRKKQASSSEVPISSSTPRDKGKKRVKEHKEWEGVEVGNIAFWYARLSLGVIT